MSSREVVIAAMGQLSTRIGTDFVCLCTLGSILEPADYDKVSVEMKAAMQPLLVFLEKVDTLKNAS